MVDTTYILAQLPSRLALPLLLALLLVLRRRHPELATRNFFFALAFVCLAEFGNSIGWLPHSQQFQLIYLVAHTVLIDSQLIAALLLAAHRRTLRRTGPLLPAEFLLNAIPLFAFCTLWGFYIWTRWPYFLCIAAGIGLLFSTAAHGRRGWRFASAGIAVYLVAFGLIFFGHFRGGAYWMLAAAFAFAVWNIRHNLPDRTIGRFAILCSLTVWSVSLLLHAGLVNHPKWLIVADNVWDLQKFFLCFGILLSLLEEEVHDAHWAALHDQLTGLPNRRLLDDRMSEAIQYSKQTGTSLAVFLIDLNDFKIINDTYGHSLGDFVLSEAARRMKSVLREGDTLARLGGDEFVILTSHANTNEALQTFKTALTSALNKPLSISGHVLSLTGAIGMARYSYDTMDEGTKIAATLLHIADKRMYSSKAAIRAAASETPTTEAMQFD